MATLIAPANAIVVSGRPNVTELLIETVTSMYPGRLVKKGTADKQVLVNTAAGLSCGILGYEQCSPDKNTKPATVDTIYTAVWAPVLDIQSDVVYNCRLKNGENVAKGAALVAAASGELKAASALSVTVASGTTTVTSTSAQPTIASAGAYGAEGPIVAYAAESVDASGSALDIMVRGA